MRYKKYLYARELNLRLKYKVRLLIVIQFLSFIVCQQRVSYERRTLKVYKTKARLRLELGIGLGLEYNTK
jgi:hypothetical protein